MPSLAHRSNSPCCSYGDVHAANTNERIYSIITQTVGAGFLGTIIANIAGFVEAVNARDNILSRKLEEVGLAVQTSSFTCHRFTGQSVHAGPKAAERATESHN